MIRVDALDRVCSLFLVMVAPWVAAIFDNSLTTPILGVSVTTIAGAVLGTFAAMGYDPNTNRPRGKVMVVAVATVIIASALVGVGPRMFGLEWVNSTTEGALATITALVVYYLAPVIVERGPDEARRIKIADLLGIFLPWIRRNQPPTRRDDDKDPRP